MRQVPLNNTLKGKLYLHSMLGRYEAWDEILKALQDHNIRKVICLTSFEEIERLSPNYAEAIQAGELPFKLLTTAITDFGIPEDEIAFFTHIKDVAEVLEKGESVLVHCAAGIGRTGMFASCLLQALGSNEEEAIATIKAAGSGPETKEQRDLVTRFALEV